MIQSKALHTVIIVCALSILFGCAQKGPLLVNMWYKPPQDLVASAHKAVVGISPFIDERGTSKSALGKKSQPSSNKENEIVIQGIVAELVTSKFKEALTARGITVKDIPAWDMVGEHIEAVDADILIGGHIKTLWTTAASSPLNVNYKADVQIKVSIADMAEKRLFRRLTLSSSLERKDVNFSLARVESMLTEALSSAIDQLMNDEEFKKRVK